MSSKAKDGIREIEPMKAKSSPEYHWCYVCKDWFYMPKEDFPAFGHYTESDYKDHLVKQGKIEPKLTKLVNANSPNKPKPVLVRA